MKGFAIAPELKNLILHLYQVLNIFAFFDQDSVFFTKLQHLFFGQRPDFNN